MAARSSSGKSKASLDPALPQKKRARRRLVGAAAVCLAAAIVLPLVLDSEPRQIRGDVQVRIPSRDTPLSDRADASTRGEAGQPAAGETVAPSDSERESPDRAGAPVERKAQAADDSRAPRADAAGAEAPVVESATRPPDAADSRGSAKTAPPRAADDPIARLAQAKEASAAKDGGYLVQIGAFSSAKGASEQVERAGKAGHKAFTERVTTAQGERIRVRVGPFATREAAEQARAKLRSAGLESVLVAP